jgi:hypothetical protein
MTISLKDATISQDPLNSPKHELSRETVRKFTKRELLPRAGEFDEMGRFDTKL